jgi:hypothetical protein
LETQCHIASLCALLVQESVEEQRQGIENLRDECLRGTSASRHSVWSSFGNFGSPCSRNICHLLVLEKKMFEIISIVFVVRIW